MGSLCLSSWTTRSGLRDTRSIALAEAEQTRHCRDEFRRTSFVTGETRRLLCWHHVPLTAGWREFLRCVGGKAPVPIGGYGLCGVYRRPVLLGHSLSCAGMRYFSLPLLSQLCATQLHRKDAPLAWRA